ncbi:TetR/AcrR family transcriptional regulator [Clostridium botulinum]|uniref:TetR/AcrR family transcriptional regulator n=1 Tax=Clostridium botulinum TaxID=1491 RepID=UPI0007732834|nr:TetR/AcrR family transcriptional regulator [Clostridium botulinum]MBY6930479.1 TetR/AcrR family transcriptional regulator [Clostridium botulinum]NFG19440.1 TetR/AcrR family transcriptional regulator [Clostridium botulinum]NFO79455.1 TetR/AcrR family transcriptional regulator [Clostridium botulinum]HBJ2620999.1 TetR/AcrR family transcriptional regulator [Clostridium botulinum]
MEENINNKRKLRIIDAAIKVFTNKSFEEITMREIAATAGLTTGAIYYHYKSKDDLLYDVINHSIHFIYKISEKDGTNLKDKDVLLSEIKNEVTIRLSKKDEQKLHLFLISYLISKNGELKEKYNENYNIIIDKVANMYLYTFGVENEKLKKSLASIFVAALDGMAIQYSLGLLPQKQKDFIKIFNDFFAESIPLFMERHLE